MEELRRCPFCGGEADIWENFGRNGYFTFCECSTCSARSKSFSLGRDLPEDWGNTIAARRATFAWNRRYADAKQDH